MKEFATKHLGALLISTLAVFAPIKGMIIVAGLAVIVDLITGIVAAKKRGEEIKSSKIGITVSKLIIVETAILMCFLIQTYLLDNAFPLVNWVAGVIGVHQIYSIMENLNSISGNQLFTSILTKLTSINHEEKKKGDEPPST